MRRISSSTLFRFVNKFEYLIDILDNGFSPRYSYEEFPTSTDKIKYRFGIPMICFCDIRLTQAKEHMERYGHFGIGMTETWRKHNRLNPVLYIEKHSLVTENLKKLHSVLYDTINKDKNSLRPLLSPFIEILRYSKPIKKTVMNNNGKKTIIYYYDEREWRYVPPLEEDVIPLLPEEYLTDTTKIDEANSKCGKLKIGILPKDIEYIIVKNKIDKGKLMNHLRGTRKIKERKLHHLISKIRLTNEIERDY